MGNWVCNNSSLDNSRSILRNSVIGYILNNSISGLSVSEVSSTVVIIDSISVAVYWGLSEVRGSVSWSSYKGSSWGTGSSSYKSSNNKGL